MKKNIDYNYLKNLKELPDDFQKRMIYGEPVTHDEMACTALSEYERYCTIEENAGRKPRMHMSEFAKMYHTSIDEMKKHFGCVDRSTNAFMKYY